MSHYTESDFKGGMAMMLFLGGVCAITAAVAVDYDRCDRQLAGVCLRMDGFEHVAEVAQRWLMEQGDEIAQGFSSTLTQLALDLQKSAQKVKLSRVRHDDGSAHAKLATVARRHPSEGLYIKRPKKKLLRRYAVC